MRESVEEADTLLARRIRHLEDRLDLPVRRADREQTELLDYLTNTHALLRELYDHQTALVARVADVRSASPSPTPTRDRARNHMRARSFYLCRPSGAIGRRGGSAMPQGEGTPMRLHRLASLALLFALLPTVWPGHAPPVAAQGEACFAETGQCIRGRFLDYWRANGGLARNGFPLTGERRELLEDGNEYVVQYFERVRLEDHPLNPAPYDVLLGQFGRRVFASSIGPGADPLPGEAACFVETGFCIRGRFLDYWRANGELAQFGYPIQREMRQRLEDGVEYTVQYFERARFELHPEHAPPYDVLLGQFGRQILADNDLLAAPFRALYVTDAELRLRLRRPAGPAAVTPGAFQAFEHGAMVWRGDARRIYVFCGGERSGRQLGEAGDQASASLFYRDTFEEGQEPGGGPAPTPGLFLPKRGFGVVWREHAEVRDCLGYATTADEAGYTLTAQVFQGGSLLSRPAGRSAYALTAAGRFVYRLYDLPDR